eukprot:4135642-Prymnesium_polylepis.2
MLCCKGGVEGWRGVAGAGGWARRDLPNRRTSKSSRWRTTKKKKTHDSGDATIDALGAVGGAERSRGGRGCLQAVAAEQLRAEAAEAERQAMAHGTPTTRTSC